MKQSEIIGKKFMYQGQIVTVLEKIKGGLKNPNAYHKSQNSVRKPSTYILSNGQRVRLDKLDKMICHICGYEHGEHSIECTCWTPTVHFL